MGHYCSDTCAPAAAPASPRFRKALRIALVVNALMLVVEIAGGLSSGSVPLLADAVDIGGDKANYALSLAVVSFGLHAYSHAALFNGWATQKACPRDIV